MKTLALILVLATQVGCAAMDAQGFAVQDQRCDRGDLRACQLMYQGKVNVKARTLAEATVEYKARCEVVRARHNLTTECGAL